MSSENIEKKCFIITPIGKDATTTRRATEGLIDAVILPALIDMGFNRKNVSVAHRISESGSINRQIITHIVEDDIAIVNLTEINPNVMYELAVRHAVAKPVVIIAEHGTNLPFDIIDQRTVFYTNDMLGVVQLNEELKSAVEDALKFEEVDNPIIKIIQENSALKQVRTIDSDVVQLIFDRLDRIEVKTTSRRNNEKLINKDKQTQNPTVIMDVRSDSDLNNTSLKMRNWLEENIFQDLEVQPIGYRMSGNPSGFYRVSH